MSTRACLWHNDPICIYEELIEDNIVHVEFVKDGVVINIPLMTVDEWKRLTRNPTTNTTHGKVNFTSFYKIAYT